MEKLFADCQRVDSLLMFLIRVLAVIVSFSLFRVVGYLNQYFRNFKSDTFLSYEAQNSCLRTGV
jgi:hypothetical protein